MRVMKKLSPLVLLIAMGGCDGSGKRDAAPSASADEARALHQAGEMLDGPDAAPTASAASQSDSGPAD